MQRALVSVPARVALGAEVVGHGQRGGGVGLLGGEPPLGAQGVDDLAGRRGEKGFGDLGARCLLAEHDVAHLGTAVGAAGAPASR